MVNICVSSTTISFPGVSLAVAFACVLVTNVKALGDDAPTPVELCATWFKWGMDLQDLPPSKRIYEYSTDGLYPLGIEKAVVESYEASRFDGDIYFANKIEFVPRAGYQLKVAPLAVSIANPRAQAKLIRAKDSSDWQIDTVSEPPSPKALTGVFRHLARIPGGYNESLTSLNSLYDIETSSQQDGMVNVKFVVRNPIDESYDGSLMRISAFTVRFSREHGWLPIQIDRVVKEGAIEYTWRTSLEQFIDFDKIIVPMKIYDPMNAKQDFSKPRNWVSITRIERVPLDDVLERCQLEYWGLVDVTKSNSRYRKFGVVFVIVVLFLLYRTRSRVRH